MQNAAIYPDLSDASIFITGGASGIGAALVEGFAAQGAKVAFIDLLDDTDTCDALATKYRHRPFCVQGDVTDTNILQGAIAKAGAAHGNITVLVNCAALDDRHIFADVKPDDWSKIMALNLKHYYFSCQAAIVQMQAAGHGSIINYSSISHLTGTLDLSVYASANAGITGLTRSLAREFGKSHIRVNTMTPGWVQTERQKRLWVTEEKLENHLKRQCLPDALIAQDLVGPTLFLASNASGKMSGQMLAVDGGVVVTG